MDLQERIIYAVIDHWPLLVALAVSLWWLFPKVLRNSLSNGSGDIIRNIVKTENALQTRAHAEETAKIVDDAIRRHEEKERRDLDIRLGDIEARLKRKKNR